VQPLPNLREQHHRLVQRDRAHPTAPVERPRVRTAVPRDGDVAAPRGDAVPEAAVDRLLRRPQRRDRLAARLHVVELCAHHLAQDPAAAMRRIDADDGDARARKRAARNAEVERERACATDDLALLERRVHSLQADEADPALDRFVIGHRPEVLEDPVQRAGELRSVAARTGLDGHQ
jgi:hypothetical protein